MERIKEREAEALIEDHLQQQGWNLTDFSVLRRQYTLPSGEEADYAFLINGKPAAFLEAKRPGKSLEAALGQAKGYAQQPGVGVTLIFSSDGKKFLRQNLAARTLHEKVGRFFTPVEFREFFNPVAKELYANLRDYQKVAVSQVFASVSSGRPKMYLQMATASGKTVTAAGIIAKLFSIGRIRKALFLVDRDALADQTVDKFKTHLGDNFKIRRLSGNPEDRFADIHVATVQFLATGDKFRLYPSDFLQLVVLDECHRSYFGDWHSVVEHFRSGGATILGLTATPSDRETVNTDLYFGPPVFRYTYRQGINDSSVPRWQRLAECVHYKFQTNVDISGVHDMGFDFEPEQLGRAVDVPKRNELIAEKFFEVTGYHKGAALPKTLVFAASIAHAVNLRHALIAKFNALNDLSKSDGRAEDFITAIHNEMPHAKELIQEFQTVRTADERVEIIKKAIDDGLSSPTPLIAVSIDMLSTGIDAPDIDVLLMARPTKSKVLYVQMKGRGTRKCETTQKESFKLIDFVDLARIEEIVTNETEGVDDVPEPEEPEPEEIPEGGTKEEESGGGETEAGEGQEMVIADVPVWLVSSEIIAPETLKSLKAQIESQIRPTQDRAALKERFRQAVLSWKFLKGDDPVDPLYLEAMGFGISALRDLYGEIEAQLSEFVAVALGEKHFPTADERKRAAVEQWARYTKKLSDEQRNLFLMLYDFKQKNPELTVDQLFNSQLLRYHGGLPRIKQLFGSLEALWQLSNEAQEEQNA